MFIIFGRRAYGRVTWSHGEFAHTRFLHVYYLPLIPESSFWVTRQVGDTVHGFEITTCWTSVVATYLRWWGPLFALGAFASGAIVAGALVTASLAAAIIYTSRWRATDPARARREAEGDARVFGTYCPPTLMTREMRQAVGRRLEERWGKISEGRAPEDMVAFGGSPEQRLIAYGLLRLAFVERCDPAAADAAARILEGLGAEALDGAPYRGDAGVVFAPADDDPRDTPDDAAADAAGWSERTLCSIGSCVGVIGPSGACNACGKRPTGAEPRPRSAGEAPAIAPRD